MNTSKGQDEAIGPDAVWREMRLHMEWNEGLSLCFLFAPDARAAAPILQWASDTWALRTAPLRLLEPAHASEAAQAILQGMQMQASQLQARAPVWVQLTAIDDTEQTGWDQARAELLSRLNEAREWLVRSYARPLVLCLPATWRAQVAQLAPDLWHIRSYTAKVLPATVGSTNSVLPQTGDRSMLAVTARQLGPVSDNLAAARVRLAQKPDELALIRELSGALHEWGDVQLELGAINEALNAYRESLDICRQLRQSVGDSPQVLRDLSVSLERVGDAEAQAGRGDAALGAYRESLDIRRLLRQSLGDSPQVLDDLAVSLVRLATQPSLEPHERQSYFQEALSLRQRLVSALPQNAWYGQRLEVLRGLTTSLPAASAGAS